MERVKHEGHERGHETAWAADRCTKAVRAQWAHQAHLANRIKKDMASPDWKPVLPADPFEGFRQ